MQFANISNAQPRTYFNFLADNFAIIGVPLPVVLDFYLVIYALGRIVIAEAIKRIEASVITTLAKLRLVRFVFLAFLILKISASHIFIKTFTCFHCSNSFLNNSVSMYHLLSIFFAGILPCLHCVCITRKFAFNILAAVSQSISCGRSFHLQAVLTFIVPPSVVLVPL